MCKNISFASQIKEEIIQKHFRECCKENLLSAIIKNNYKIDNKNFIVSTSSEIINSYFTQYLIELFPEVKITTEILKKTKYFSYLNHIINFDRLINDLNILNKKTPIYEKNNKDHCIRAYIAGLFISSGSINSPATSNYHLEIIFKKNNNDNKFIDLISEFNFNFKITIRNNNIIYYLKKSNSISDFLKFIDSPKCVMNFENQRIERDFINNINRLNNIDLYNLQKILKASKNQILMINFLIENNLFDNLDSKTQKIANLRLKYQESSLEELANYMNEFYQINISKPGVNHLFRKIKHIYKKNQ